MNDPGAEVAALLAGLDDGRRQVVLAVRATILAADPAIREGVKWNAPSYHTSGHFATFQLRGRVQLVLHLGARPRPDARLREAVPDAAGLLEWRGADRALLTFASAEQAASRRDAITAIIQEWMRHL